MPNQPPPSGRVIKVSGFPKIFLDIGIGLSWGKACAETCGYDPAFAVVGGFLYGLLLNQLTNKQTRFAPLFYSGLVPVVSTAVFAAFFHTGGGFMGFMKVPELAKGHMVANLFGVALATGVHSLYSSRAETLTP